MNTIVLDNKTYFIIPIEIEMISLDFKGGKYSKHLIFNIHRESFDILQNEDFILYDTKNNQYHLFNEYEVEAEPLGYPDKSNEYVTVTGFVSNHYENVTRRILIHKRKEKIKNILE